MSKPTVYYDGACPVCSREIAVYRRAQGAEALEFVDAAHCDAAALGGLSREEALAVMHVRRADGSLAQGARAFGEIWQALPRWRALAWLLRLPGATWCAETLYRGFLRMRRVWRPAVNAPKPHSPGH